MFKLLQPLPPSLTTLRDSGRLVLTPKNPHQEHTLNLSIFGENSITACCGARAITSQCTWKRRGEDREFSSPFYLTHTLGINIIPGRVHNLETYPNETVVEVPVKGNILTFSFVSSYTPLENFLPPVDETTDDFSSGKKLVLSDNEQDVKLYCPIFSSWAEGGGQEATKQFWIALGYSQEMTEAQVDRHSNRCKELKTLQENGNPLLFIVTDSQYPSLLATLTKYQLQNSILFSQRNIVNYNYTKTDNPRLNIVLIKGKE